MSNKKFYLVGMAVLLSVSLFLIGCPTEAADGANGTSPTPSGSATGGTASDLDAYFNRLGWVEVVLPSSVTTVDGVVPQGRTLIVTGGAVVQADKSLEVNGTLEIRANAGLDASFVSGTSGYLKGAGTVKGDGGVKLPYLNGTTLSDGALHYGSTSVTAVKAVGSYRDTNTAAGPASGALSAANVQAIFAIEGGPDTLTVGDLTGIVAATIPQDKTLTLTGAGSTAALDLSAATAGTLIVDEDAVLTVTTSIKGNSTTPNITVNGTLKLAGSATALEVFAGVDVSKATIDATAAGAATLTLPAALTAVRSITGHATNVLTITGPTALTVDTIPGTAGVKSDTVKKYATGASGADFVQLATAQATLIISKVDNGEFTVETGSSSAIAIGSALTFGGDAKIKLNGTGGISVTGVASTGYLELTNANLGRFVSGKITVSDGATGIAETLVIPEDLEVDASTAATLATITGLTVNGTLTLGASATLAAATTLTVDGDLTVNAGLVLTAITNATTAITGEGTITAAAAITDAPTAVKLVGSAVKTVTLKNATLAGPVAVPAGTVRIYDAAITALTGVVTVNGYLVLKDATTIGENGEVVINQNGAALALVTGKAITMGHASAKITSGTYAITTEGTTGTLTAGVADTVVIFRRNVIAGYVLDYTDFTKDLAGLTSDPTSAATLTFGVADSTLTVSDATTVAGVILDVSAYGKISVGNTKTLTLALGEGDDHVGSGGIFTKEGGVTTTNAVKANGVQNATGLTDDTATGLASATIANAGSTTAVKATTPAAGVITASDADVEILKEVAFEVTDAVITLDS